MLRYRRWISKSASWSAEQWPSGIRIHAAGGYGSEHPDPDPDNDVDSKAPPTSWLARNMLDGTAPNGSEAGPGSAVYGTLNWPWR